MTGAGSNSGTCPLVQRELLGRRVVFRRRLHTLVIRNCDFEDYAWISKNLSRSPLRLSLSF